MARSNRLLVLGLFLGCLCLVRVSGYAQRSDLTVRKAPRLHLPFLGIGTRCNGCPNRSCEDDPAVVYGYCCGCSRFLDKLPVLCPTGLSCPLNGAGLCHDYEYMLVCCC